MEWTQIISLVLNLVLGGSLIVTLVTLRATKAKATAEADSAKAQSGKDNVELVNGTVATMVETVNKLMLQNKELIDRYATKSDEYEKLTSEKNELEGKISELEKRVNRMIQTNLKVIKALESLGVDEEVIEQLRQAK